MWKWLGLFLKKNHLLRCWGWLSLLSCFGGLTLSIVKLPPRKLKPWSVLWSFFLLKFLSNVVDGAPRCYLEWLDMLEKRICWFVDPSRAACLESLAHYWNVAGLSLFSGYYFGRCLSGLAQLHFWRTSTRYSYRLMIFFHYS